MTRANRSTKPTKAQAKPEARRPKSPLVSDRGERQTQFTLQMRESLHRELARKALDSGMTMRGYIMSALKKSGLKVDDSDLIDRRRR